ncbi:DUF4328 domain-containing protein [Kribbella sp. NPDC051620]|uniref:DUF4328 domain-containing protein n=1 Tax=Kribbella sp. NPDC051620 TaxID=3364120 RepID=UPI00378F5466
MRALPRATSILVWIAALAYVLVAVEGWRDYAVFKDDLAGWDSDTIRPVDVILYGLIFAAAVVFVVWLWRARTRSEELSPWLPHRHERGWVIAGWIVPIISFWYPLHVVEDVVAASTPQVTPGPPERPQPDLRIVHIWWGTWLASNLIELLPVEPGEDPVANDFLWTAVTSTATAVLTVVCAVYAVRVIRLITELQVSRPADELAPGLPPFQH